MDVCNLQSAIAIAIDLHLHLLIYIYIYMLHEKKIKVFCSRIACIHVPAGTRVRLHYMYVNVHRYADDEKR